MQKIAIVSCVLIILFGMASQVEAIVCFSCSNCTDVDNFTNHTECKAKENTCIKFVLNGGVQRKCGTLTTCEVAEMEEIPCVACNTDLCNASYRPMTSLVCLLTGIAVIFW